MTWATWCTSCVPMWPDHGSRSNDSGISVSTDSCLRIVLRTTVAASSFCGETSTSIAWSRLPMVAEMPQVCIPGAMCRNQAAASSTCTPRFEPISSCHSSATSTLMCLQIDRCCLSHRRRCKLSGVVMSTWGSFSFCFRLSADEVSPVRIPTVTSHPHPSASRVAAKWISLAKARMGVSHTTWRPRSGCKDACFMAGTSNEYDFPLPVGAFTKPSKPRLKASHVCNWNSNGCHPFDLNH